MTKMEREGMEEFKKDNDHIYKMEDKGSCMYSQIEENRL